MRAARETQHELIEEIVRHLARQHSAALVLRAQTLSAVLNGAEERSRQL